MPIFAAEGLAMRPVAPRSCSFRALSSTLRSTRRKRLVLCMVSISIASMPWTGTPPLLVAVL
ncbi:hypothetical protein QQ73_21540 [Candidatus Endoriftia persephone str. Guaymas]|nr:hypothetical protein [Candidatus Endoriftia persephone str. Guaymas]